jgi:mRNA-degrading endonuclease toxin of MazEF toxin-antitoxin module
MHCGVDKRLQPCPRLAKHYGRAADEFGAVANSIPTTVLFRSGESGLPKECAALAHQITTIDRNKLIGGVVGCLSETRLIELENALRNYLAI